jgi:hypothetical protein
MVTSAIPENNTGRDPHMYLTIKDGVYIFTKVIVACAI